LDAIRNSPGSDDGIRVGDEITTGDADGDAITVDVGRTDGVICGSEEITGDSKDSIILVISKLIGFGPATPLIARYFEADVPDVANEKL
jgi:hypothetical protein